jgi:hypothetical protein
MGCEEIIKVFFHMQNNIKLYHWQTESFARHKASDELLDNISDLIDQFIEVYIGRYDRPKFKNNFKILVTELDNDGAEYLIQSYINFMKNELPKYLEDNDTDLYNIRDELLGNLNKTLYLFTFN